MASVEKINLENIIWNRVHSPLVDGKPLYLRSDGGTDDGVSRTPKWENTAAKTYNSPNNIRRVFITSKYILVNYYQPIVGQKTLSNKVSLEKFGIDSLIETSISTGTPLNNLAIYTGNGLSAIYKPWVCSNIEEIYFDHTILLSSDITTICADIMTKLNIDPTNYTMLDVALKAGTIPLEAVKEIFKAGCLKNTNDLRDRFPRLKAVGYVQNLALVVAEASRLNTPGKKSLLDIMLTSWYDNELVKKLVEQRQATILKMDDVPKLNNKFSLRSGIYTYDDTILKRYFTAAIKVIDEEAYKIKSERLRLEKQKSDFESEIAALEHSNSKSELEITLDKINNPDIIQSIIDITFRRCTANEKKEALEGMTVEGQKKYIEYF